MSLASGLLPKLSLSMLMTVTLANGAHAHFQKMIPSTNVVDQETGRDVSFDLTFTHPMTNGPAMQMEKPLQFGMQFNGDKTDLLGNLLPKTVDEQSAFDATVALKAPGGYAFYVEPVPYFEPSEGKYIIQYTKTIIDAHDAGEDWDQMVGFPVEIEPLTRPYGIWTGNVFSGMVRHNGEPVPFAEVEVEYANDGSIELPNATFATQVIKADANGIFHYAMPKDGWWVFAALIEDGTMAAPNSDQQVPVERGGVMWVKTDPMD
jgi:cobalt/nickel transport protein